MHLTEQQATWASWAFPPPLSALDASDAPAPAFTPMERAALTALRARYGQDGDQFDARALGRLRFLRWLVQRGRLTD